MQRVHRRTGEQEVAIKRSADAYARGEKTLAEHELYVGALLDGTVVPARKPKAWRRVAVALGAAAVAAIMGAVTCAAFGEDDRPRAQRAGETRTTPGPPAPVVSDKARLQGAVIAAREAYLDATMVSRGEQSLKPDVTGGTCDKPQGGVYRCRTFEQSAGSAWGAEFEVAVDAESCWRALPVEDGSSTGTTVVEPLEGCLRHGEQGAQ